MPDAAAVSSVRMTVMNVRKMSVPVHGGFVQVRVRMRFGGVPLECVGMLMVFVMAMRVHVLEGFVDMLVDVFFAEMQPQTERHERRGDT
jgi:hypothetical protein